MNQHQMQPVRHALGALLLEQGEVQEATSVYRTDLAMHPRNVWALHGLRECLQETGQGHTPEYDGVDRQLRDAEAVADVKVTASCLCRRGACCSG